MAEEELQKVKYRVGYEHRFEERGPKKMKREKGDGPGRGDVGLRADKQEERRKWERRAERREGKGTSKDYQFWKFVEKIGPVHPETIDLKGGPLKLKKEQ